MKYQRNIQKFGYSVFDIPLVNQNIDVSITNRTFVTAYNENLNITKLNTTTLLILDFSSSREIWPDRRIIERTFGLRVCS